MHLNMREGSKSRFFSQVYLLQNPKANDNKRGKQSDILITLHAQGHDDVCFIKHTLMVLHILYNLYMAVCLIEINKNSKQEENVLFPVQQQFTRIYVYKCGLCNLKSVT